ncbi:MAG: L-asparaginase [Curvibacter sp. RIFCSPHIGHO2_12_FULL_63_18]|uniref:asparaginase n=1 Tax=Rhodoferax sp. TaxID=50421 RepID=UPI0008D41737|nr:asparaginase [Rhodoferax sp.]OGO94899.1 MAG: L-asparaginase [Curvibacter sp. GWA2_63_95]OGP01342.1 MAG: L-asparaginase [Curvibacter sp. RIFCSPHIGHO2_12_FULL_63_18]HCX82219.1 asparaginase [Rhodoferax sp.]
MGKKVVVLGTGGTIAGRSERGSDNVGYKAGQVGVQSLLQDIAPLQAALQGRTLVAEQVAQVDSKDMGFAVWAVLAQRCAQHLQDAEVDAVLITHGTDTLEETAFFLEQVLPPALLQAKPLVLTCAMRPASALTPDGPQNVLDAVAVALDGTARGVLVVCAGAVHSARLVQKSHTYRVDAFDSGDAGPLAVVEEGRVRWFGVSASTTPSHAVDLQAWAKVAWPRVEIVMNYVGASGAMVRSLARPDDTVAPLRGLVVAGTGNGTLHVDLEAALLEVQAQGVQVVRASRCARGQVVQGEATAALPHSRGLSPVKARIALTLQLMA